MMVKIELAHALVTLVLNKGDTKAISGRIRSILASMRDVKLTQAEIEGRLLKLYDACRDELEKLAFEFIEKTFYSRSFADKRLARGIFRRMVNIASEYIEKEFPEAA